MRCEVCKKYYPRVCVCVCVQFIAKLFRYFCGYEIFGDKFCPTDIPFEILVYFLLSVHIFRSSTVVDDKTRENRMRRCLVDMSKKEITTKKSSRYVK